MEKEIILLTKSKKYNNYCIAGIDKETGEWIRIISEEQSINHAVEPKDIVYENDEEAEILDCIRIMCKGAEPNYYQPENYVFDESYYWEKTEEASVTDVVDIYEQTNDDFIFYNNDKKVSKDDVKSIPVEDRYSLILIEPTNVTVQVKYWHSSSKISVTASFMYKDNYYQYIPITDQRVKDFYLQMGDGIYELRNVLFVLSLADEYPGDHCHYKLIASVINK